MPENQKNTDFNYWITKVFLTNSRLTILSLVSLIIFGIVSVLLLKTTGFPNPEIKIAFVQTVYPGASSQTILEEVTVPLEGAIKNVEGVSRYSSTSSSSFSIVSITLSDNADSDTVINRLESVISAVELPSGAQSPIVRKPIIGGSDLVIAFSAESREKLFTISHQIKQDVTQLQTLASVQSPSSLQKFAVVNINPQKAAQFGISTQAIQAAVSTIGESIPVVNGVEIEGANSGILTKIEGQDLESLKNLPLKTNVPPQFASQLPSSVSLQDIADISIDYLFEKEADMYGFVRDGKPVIASSEFIYFDAVDGSDQVQFNKQITDILTSYSSNDVVVTDSKNVAADFDSTKVNAIQVYAVATENQEQIDEVIGGLIGAPLAIENQVLAQVGWLLGGIQLVVLVMIAFVSWRAAIIAAAAIPLSLIFTTIYLYIIGESLNTLVLFSLVLVIGLVVDPALVILEAIQRKIDAGKHGNDAVLAAVKDVGKGIFLASLTNIIVFAPFGVLSGFLGQIFAYIPLTILPAIVGSYIVPLVFLAWLGGIFLRPNKQARAAIASAKNMVDAEKELDKLEEKNMWPIARNLTGINRSILASHPLVRLSIIVVLLALSFAVVWGYTATEGVRVAQFATNENTNILLLTGTHKAQNVAQNRKQKEAEVMQDLLQKEQILEVHPFFGQTGFTYRVTLDINKLQNGQNSLEFAEQTTLDLQNKFKDDFFDIKLDILQTGPPTADYQVTIAVYTDNFDVAKKATADISARMFDLCKLPDNSIVILANCVDENGNNGQKLVTKVDDGFTGKAENLIEVVINRQKLQAAQATVPNAPLTILVNQTIAQLYQVNRGETVADVKINDELVGVLLKNNVESPKTIEEIKNISIFTLTGNQILLRDVADVLQVQPPQNIQRNRGQTVTLVQARLNSENVSNQTSAAGATTALVAYYSENDFAKTTELGLKKETISNYDDGSAAGFQKTFTELLFALVIAIILSYLVLVLFFKSFTQPLAIIYTVPLTFMGVYPALAYFGGGQIGFLEIIGIIILVGVVENVAIFLIDSANQKIEEGMPEKEAIALAAGIRFRPVFLTSLTALASLLPLAIFSVFYRSIAVVIMSGILVSGVVSLITTPILYVFFRWLSRAFRGMKALHQSLFIALPFAGISLFVLVPQTSLPAWIATVFGTALLLTPLGYIIVLAMTKKGKEITHS